MDLVDPEINYLALARAMGVKAARVEKPADLRDALAVLDSVTFDAVPFVGHSKGGGILLSLAEACPHRLSHLVTIDGLPSPRPRPDVADHERTRLLDHEITGWLDHRRRAASKERRAGTLDDLARRRGRMNPRLPHEWLRYLVTVGGRQDDDGWRWKIDPALRLGGFGPWRPEWAMKRLPGLSMPLLAVLACEPELMGWGTRPEDIVPFLPPGARLEPLDGVGHFVHIEQPHAVAAAVVAFLRDN
jgi:pimeloyl-ACP methyl ester carboxylesterase